MESQEVFVYYKNRADELERAIKWLRIWIICQKNCNWSVSSKIKKAYDRLWRLVS